MVLVADIADNGRMETLQQAAVLVPVYRDSDAGINVVLIRRREGGLHGGELAFPGGRHSPMDETLLDTALREALEEIGLAPTRVRLIERLPSIDTISTGMRITPFLGSIDRPRDWVLCAHEVAEVIEIPVVQLMEPAARGECVRELPGLGAPRRFPFIRIGEHQLWGASYRILQPLLGPLLRNRWAI